MTAAVRRRLVLSLVAIFVIGGGTLGLAAKSGTLKKKRPSLTSRSVTPSVRVNNIVPGDRIQRVVILTNTRKHTLNRLRFEMAERPPKIAGKRVKAPRGKKTPAGYEWARRCVVTKKKLKNKKIRRVTRCQTRLRPAPSPLLTNRAGLRVRVEACPVAWKRTSKVTFACPAKVRVKVRTRMKNGKYRTRVVTKRIRPTVLVANLKLPVRGVHRRIPKVPPRGRMHIRITTSLSASAGNELQGKSVVLIPRFGTPGIG